MHDGSTGGGSRVQKQIQDLNVTKSTLKVVSTSNRAKEIEGTPSIVASSCVHVNVYGGSRNEPTTIVNNLVDQRQIQDLKLTNSTFKVFGTKLIFF